MKVQQQTYEFAKHLGFDLETCTCGGFPECICNDEEPFQHILQKWLREIKKIRIFVKNSASGEFTYEIYVVNPIVEDRIGRPWERKYYYKAFRTYEDALEDGLNESLKLLL